MKLKNISDITLIKTGITTTACTVPVLSVFGVALAEEAAAAFEVDINELNLDMPVDE
jgi:hypothetical protein